MKKVLIYALLLTGCSCGSGQVDIESEVKKTQTTVNMPDSLSEQERELRVAGIILHDYLELKDSAYYLTISQEDAFKLGVKDSLYREVVKTIKATNEVIKEYNQNGKHIELLDISEMKKHIQ